ncbi:adenylate/guanylate cyclase domain-containing protein [Leptospira semungkisensis]|uniref:Adenylate/guanylate cyclase domain-containing protein n=1 Tax=Leptospira semungkisensis TaxID=2484985 RepID=A0A4R9G9C5_9LEPT|nr:adenylate/guanylate cyclase domain-containing protein [Leptospira semungkisensis]TGK07660.1 adenylate/guanylate cyclase domain-containing protein [Leptospira semungkisensis]
MLRFPLKTHSFLIIALVSSLFIFSCADSSRRHFPTAKDGILDLRDWDFQKDGSAELNGDWQFYWMELIPAHIFEEEEVPHPTGLISIPGLWNGYEVDGKPASPIGQATYRLTLLLPENSPNLAIRVDDGQGSAYDIYWNGQRVAGNGIVGTSEAEERAEYLPQTSPVSPRTEVQVVVHVSNHVHRNGGFQMPIILGEATKIFGARDRLRLTSAFLAGALLIMGLYHMGLFFYRKKDTETLWFSLICLTITMRVLLSGERFLGEAVPFVPWVIMIKAEYLAFYLGVPIMALFVRRLFPNRFHKSGIIAILILSLSICVSVIVLPPALFSHTLPFYQILIATGGSYAIVVLIIASFKEEDGALLMLSGLVLFFASVINDFIFYLYHIGPGYLTPAGLFLLTFSNAAMLGRRVAKAFNTSEELSLHLEKKVIERTKELSEERDRTVEARNEAEIQRAKSDRLLLNILPKTVAEELKEKGTVSPVYYDSATILFTDFVGFTKTAEEMLPAALVENLHACFSKFDSVVSDRGLEKLKTIGDSYMCAGGIPSANFSHAVDSCLAGLEFQNFMKQIAESKAAQSLPFWELRVGIHTGPVTSGVIGSDKFAYDVWGDAVNTASRMESSGKAGYVNISGATYEIVKDFFVCEHRGKIQAKGKGEVDMYFVLSIQPSLSEGGEGKLPNEKFHSLKGSLTLK